MHLAAGHVPSGLAMLNFKPPKSENRKLELELAHSTDSMILLLHRFFDKDILKCILRHDSIMLDNGRLWKGFSKLPVERVN